MKIRAAIKLGATVAVLVLHSACADSQATIAGKGYVEAGHEGVAITAVFPKPFGQSTLTIRRSSSSRQQLLFESLIGEVEVEVGAEIDNFLAISSIPEIAYRCQNNPPCTTASSVLFVFEVGRPYLNPLDSTDIISNTYSIEIFSDKRVETLFTVTGDVLRGQ